jgi:hypothetical protein
MDATTASKLASTVAEMELLGTLGGCPNERAKCGCILRSKRLWKTLCRRSAKANSTHLTGSGASKYYVFASMSLAQRRDQT